MPPTSPPLSERSELLPCLVFKATPDGYVVGRALVMNGDVEWVSPTHVRPFKETRPKDVLIPAQKQGAIASSRGLVELKPARMAKGIPVSTQVGVEVVFGEMLEAAALRAKRELKAQVDAVVRKRKTYWRHLCRQLPRDGWQTWRAVPHGEACECGATESKRRVA